MVTGAANPEIFEELASGEVDIESPSDSEIPASGEAVSIMPGAWTTQDLGDPDEFADAEDQPTIR